MIGEILTQTMSQMREPINQNKMTKPELRKQLYSLITKETGKAIPKEVHKEIKSILKQYEQLEDTPKIHFSEEELGILPEPSEE